jgi:hypothetical protein
MQEQRQLILERINSKLNMNKSLQFKFQSSEENWMLSSLTLVINN